MSPGSLKWSHYEQSLRVPLIVHDPRLPKESGNRVLSPLVMNLDLPATMLDFAGVTIPGKYQGASLLPFVRGEKPSSWRTDFFNEHLMNHERIPKWRGVHGERYTYARYFEQDPVCEFLYDLEKDPDQINNLAYDPEHAALLKRMRARTDELTKQYTRPEIVKLKKQSKK